MKKIDPRPYDTQRADLVPHYIPLYEKYFAPLADEPIVLFEIGVKAGGSLQMWRDYFTRGTIVGLDRDPLPAGVGGNRIHFYRGSQDDTRLLKTIAAAHAPAGFDVIIDDCSHIGQLTRTTFDCLFTDHLKPGGLYCIEDWGTGYWGRYVDGAFYRPPRRGVMRPAYERMSKTFAPRLASLGMRKVARALNRLPFRRQTFPSHQHGMVGLVKQLVDELAAADITNEKRGVPPARVSTIRSMELIGGVVLVVKA